MTAIQPHIQQLQKHVDMILQELQMFAKSDWISIQLFWLARIRMEIVVLQMMNLQLPVQVLLFQELQICVER